MVIKTKLVLRDSLSLLWWIFVWLMLFFNVWDWGLFVLSYGGLMLVLHLALRVPYKFQKFGKVRVFTIFAGLIIWIIVTAIARSYEIDTNSFQALPNWLKLVNLLVFLIVAAALVSKIHQDNKFSEKVQERQ